MESSREKIICPECGKGFEVAGEGYANILQQIRNREFDKAVELQVRFIKEKADMEKALLQEQLDHAQDNYQKELAEETKKFEAELNIREEEIQRLKNFKISLSTKMIGESLERYCEAEFNKVRSLGFQHAYFEKDNDTKDKTKGDYIFRDYAEDGTEFISIMFEMKNEADETVTKHKNENFFDKLNKDREKKQCEYAVLVSMLENDSELYNSGIVDVSHKYPKMYVIRPQFFIPLITLLRNAASNSVQYKQEMERMKQKEVDLTQFEANLQAFKTDFSKTFNNAQNNYKKSIEAIDAAIQKLMDAKETLETMNNQYGTAKRKEEDITIKKLTKGAPAVAEQLEELKKM